MKKFILGLLALISMAFIVTSCEMKYDEDYPELVQYYCCYGNSSGTWYDHAVPNNTLMTYDVSTGKYSIEIEAKVKNWRFEITKGAGYSIEYMADAKGVQSADAETLANFPKTADSGYGSLQTVLPEATTYVITFDPATEKYNVAIK